LTKGNEAAIANSKGREGVAKEELSRILHETKEDNLKTMTLSAVLTYKAAKTNDKRRGQCWTLSVLWKKARNFQEKQMKTHSRRRWNMRGREGWGRGGRRKKKKAVRHERGGGSANQGKSIGQQDLQKARWARNGNGRGTGRANVPKPTRLGGGGGKGGRNIWRCNTTMQG